MSEGGGGSLRALDRLVAIALSIAAPARRLQLRGEPDTIALVGIGWATVDAERAADELRGVLGLPLVDAVMLPEDATLGARCLRLAAEAGDALAAAADGPAIILLEPVHEGRLAAALARFGEGVAAVWVAPGLDDTRLLARANLVGLVLSAVGRGPFGAQRLVLGGPAWGPHLVLTAPGATMTA